MILELDVSYHIAADSNDPLRPHRWVINQVDADRASGSEDHEKDCSGVWDSSR